MNTHTPQQTELVRSELSATPGNQLAAVTPSVMPAGGALATITSNTAVTEKLASIYIAKAFPRDLSSVTARVNQSCSRISLAQKAAYSFPRGGQTVTGPSIRLMEALVSAWGNIQYGWEELNRYFDPKGNNGLGCMVSECLAYCFDKETNVTRDMKFIVPHVRDTKNGGIKLESERDIYEICANMASRRVRSCIQQVIPSWLVEEAMDVVRKTLENGDKRPIADIRRSMVAKFSEYGVTKEMLEANLGHSIDETTKPELVRLGATYNAIADGQVRVRDVFTETAAPAAPLSATPASAVAAPAAAVNVAAPAAEQPEQPAATEADHANMKRLEDAMNASGKNVRQLTKDLAKVGVEVPKGASRDAYARFATQLFANDEAIASLEMDGWIFNADGNLL